MADVPPENIIAIVFHFNKFKEEFIKMKNYMFREAVGQVFVKS
jgi:hypothetical protein